jgi:hypothetical protein
VKIWILCLEGLQAAHAPLVTSDETLVLSGALIASTRDILPKGFFTGEFDAKVSVVLTLTTAASGKGVWHDSFRVSDSITSSSPTAPRNMLNGLLDKLVAKLLANEDFLRQMRSWNATCTSVPQLNGQLVHYRRSKFGSRNDSGPDRHIGI